MEKGNGNGHKVMEEGIPHKVKQTLSQSQLAPLFGQHELPNALNMLVQPGEEVQKALMRVRFRNRAERIATIHLLALDEQFGDELGKRELFNNIVAAVSDGGEGRHELVKAIIGDAAMKRESGFGSWLKHKAGFKDDD